MPSITLDAYLAQLDRLAACIERVQPPGIAMAKHILIELRFAAAFNYTFVRVPMIRYALIIMICACKKPLRHRPSLRANK
jgi:hypothetical protein